MCRCQGRHQNGITGRVLFRLLREPNDKAVAAPKLDVVTVDQALGLVDCLGIIDGNQRLKSDEVPIEPDCIYPVFRHPRTLPPPALLKATWGIPIPPIDLFRRLSGAGLRNSNSPDGRKGREPSPVRRPHRGRGLVPADQAAQLAALLREALTQIVKYTSEHTGQSFGV
jgi:hypothetical protein